MDHLQDYSLELNPITTFKNWHAHALTLEQNADAMNVATFDSEKKRPNSRYILFKGLVSNKIVFYTNYLSAKSKDLDLNPEIALAFYWHNSKKQVRIHGKVAKMDKTDSEKYFFSRDRESQIASFLSSQSGVIENKDALLLKFKQVTEQFEGKSIPMPEHWGGYYVDPYEFEFFLYGEHRLNDRFLYQLKNNQWNVFRFQP